MHDEKIINELQEEINNGKGCIIFDFGCYFPFADQDRLKFDFSLGMKEITDFKLNHRYPNRNYITISKKTGKKVSKLGYPYFCKLGKHEMLLKIHMCYEDININIVFPIEIELSKDKPVCALTSHINFTEAEFEFRYCCKEKEGWKVTVMANYERENFKNAILVDSPILISDNTFLYSNIIRPYAQSLEELFIL